MSYMHIGNLYKDKRILLFKECYAMEKIHGCLQEDSKVMLPNGEEIPIRDIKKGDIVLTFDRGTNKFAPNRVLSVLNRDADTKLKWIKLNFDNGRFLICTDDHRVLTRNRGWVAAGELNENDDLETVIN